MTDDGDDVCDLTMVQNRFHDENPNLATATSAKLEEAVDWLEAYKSDNGYQLDEEAHEWLIRTKEHLKSRL